MTNEQFEQFIKDRQEPQLYESFTWLVEKVWDYYKTKPFLLDHDDMIQESVLFCYKKLPRFNSDKGKAFNFFSTCVSGFFVQHRSRKKSYEEFKEKYREHLKTNSPLDNFPHEN